MKTATGLIGLALALAACGTNPAASKTQGAAAMTVQRLQACAPRSATLILIEEGLLTRTAVTAATAASHATPVELTAGDPRLARLEAMLKTLKLGPAKLAQFDPRTFLRMACADGSTLEVEGSATEDGTMHLKIGGEYATTTAPLRRDLAALAE